MNATQKLIDVAYDTAIDAALKASDAVMPFWPNPSNPRFDPRLLLEVVQKEEGIGNFATAADHLAEQTIIQTISSRRQFQSHSRMAEESGEVKGDADWVWSIDPIDGTDNFRNGSPDFGICVALFHEGRPVLGLIAMPFLREFAIVKEGGIPKLISYDGRALADLRVWAKTFTDPLEKATVGFNLAYENRQRQLAEIAKKVTPNVGNALCLGSFATGNFRVVQGTYGAYFGKSPTVMDIAPAAALIPAIGGRITDMDGKPIDWTAPRRTYLGAVNGQIHEQFLEAMSLSHVDRRGR